VAGGARIRGPGNGLTTSRDARTSFGACHQHGDVALVGQRHADAEGVDVSEFRGRIALSREDDLVGKEPVVLFSRTSWIVARVFTAFASLLSNR